MPIRYLYHIQVNIAEIFLQLLTLVRILLVIIHEAAQYALKSDAIVRYLNVFILPNYLWIL